MSGTSKPKSNGYSHAPDEDQWPGIASRFQLIVVAALRNKQLLRGALPRIEADPRKRRNTSIALEEVKRGLVPFTTTRGDQVQKINGAEDALPQASDEKPSQVRR